MDYSKSVMDTCMPSKAKMSMNKKRRKRRERMDRMELSNEITRFLREDQYLRTNKTFF
jgi:hypothetical protein